MRKIAVIVHSLTAEYTLDILNGISTYFKDKDIKLFVCPVRIPHSGEGLYDYQDWCIFPLAFSEQIDGVIIITGSFLSDMSVDELSSIIKTMPSKKIISIGSKLNIPDSCYIHTEFETAYDKVVRHLKKEHGCKKIGFLSANLTQSIEAEDRFTAYKNALKKNSFEYDENLVIHGKFTTPSAVEAIKTAYKTKKDVPFDALLVANDLMAVGAQNALQELGVRVPEDVKIIGFDYTTHGNSVRPKLSTIDQKIFYQGVVGAQLMEKLLDGKKVNKETSVQVEPIYKQSCGCVPINNAGLIYKNAAGKLCQEYDDVDRKENGHYYDFLSEISAVYSFFDLTHSTSTIRRFFYQLRYYMETAKISAMGIFLYNQPMILTRDSDFVLPEEMNATMYEDFMQTISEYSPQMKFNPYKEIIPEKFNNENIAGTYLITPVSSGETNYGFMVSRLENNQYGIYLLFLKILVSTFCQSYEYATTLNENQKLSEENQLLHQSNTDLKLESKSDELTKILNRRGFLEFGQRSIEIAVGMDTPGLVLFADMDGLKAINDTYGHKVGDVAIKAMADVLSSTLRASDVVARIGGDEFAAIAVGMTHEHEERLRAKIEKLCNDISVRRKFPFKLSCSIGTSEFNAEHSNLQDLLIAADERQYVEKNQKHMAKSRR